MRDLKHQWDEWGDEHAETRRGVTRVTLVIISAITLGFGAYLLRLTYIELQRTDIDLLRLNWLAIAVLGYLVIVSGIVKALDHGRETHWFFSLIGELNSEFTGALVTGILFLVVLTIPSERKAEQEQRERLLREMGSRDNSTALQAVDELREYGWLEDGSLRDVALIQANLRYADLWSADLQYVTMWSAILEDAELILAQLQGINLSGSSCRRAIFNEAHMQNASLRDVDFTDATFLYTNLQGADLVNAILTGAEFDDATVLPDGSFWSADTDLSRFTDPDHPDFWRSDDSASPAYHGARNRITVLPPPRPIER